tara:strand:- start:4922 stop:5428 length:507 start_codon:yes stop_codon:yes gene_type:complete
MSESPVVVIVSGSQSNIIQPQIYTNLSIVYNPSDVVSEKSEADFYNSVIQTSNYDSNSIYGFLSAHTNLNYENSVTRIVDFFQRNEHINIVVCDMATPYGGFDSYQHVHPNMIHTNIPFFIRGSILNKLKFSDKDNILQQALIRLIEMNQIIFHIAEPLIIKLQESSA